MPRTKSPPPREVRARQTVDAIKDENGANGGDRRLRLRAHQEERLVGEAGVLRAQALGVVLFLYVNKFFRSGNGRDGYVIVASFFKDHQTAKSFVDDEVEREIAVGHGHDGIESVGIAGANKVTELLADDVDFFAFVEFGGAVFDFFSDDIADAAKLFVAVGVRGFAFKNHFAAFEHCALGDQDSGVVAGIFVAVRDEPFSEIVDVEFMFWNHAAMSGSGHSGKHSGEAGVATKNFQHEEALMRAGGSAQIVCQLNGARDAGAEADAIVGAGNVIVHGFGNGHDFETFLMQANAVTERVIAADRHHVIDAEPFKILQDFGSEIVFLGVVLAFEMFGHVGFVRAAGVGARGMQKRSAGASGAIDDVFGEDLEVFRIVVGFVAHDVDQAAPSVAEANDLIAFTERAEGDSANRGIESGDIAASGEDADDAFAGADVRHE